MKVYANLYRYDTTIVDGVPERVRSFVAGFFGLLIPLGVREKNELFGNYGLVEYRLYPLQPVSVLVSDEIEIEGKRYSVVSVEISPSVNFAGSILLRGVDDDGG